MLLLSVNVAIAQTTIKGTVFSADDNEPLIGANILVEGTQKRAITDIDGNFTLSDVKHNAVLVVSMMGMRTERVKAKNGMRILMQNEDTQMNERWLDGHLCSYYHRIGKSAFEAMKNNVRNLKKPYYPMAGLSGYASWVRPGEVLNPRQIRQFALAAFVNGCPGYALYPGNCFDGEMLLAMMQAQDIAARYEDLPWGKVDGKTVVAGPMDRMACASTVRPDGSEVVAVFNYDEMESIGAKVGEKTCTVPPFGVEFVEMGPTKRKE